MQVNIINFMCFQPSLCIKKHFYPQKVLFCKNLLCYKQNMIKKQVLRFFAKGGGVIYWPFLKKISGKKFLIYCLMILYTLP